MNQPTTGVIVGDFFYYIANSQLQFFKGIFKPDGTFEKSKLSEPIVLRLRL
ncbi:MAG: hypothetical protein H0V88_04610 [Pyrinomonadaceae bacterium]|nr:hypothetical protein [Pyrinomonadaceae bacterium]